MADSKLLDRSAHYLLSLLDSALDGTRIRVLATEVNRNNRNKKLIAFLSTFLMDWIHFLSQLTQKGIRMSVLAPKWVRLAQGAGGGKMH